MRRKPIILREFTGIRCAPAEEASYEANLRECLFEKRRACAEADFTGAGHAARGAAECYRRLGDLDEAAQEFQASAAFFSAAADVKGLAWTLLSFSNLLRQRSQFQAALAALSECAVLSRACHDAGLAAYVIAGTGETLRILGNYRLATRLHLEAYRIFRSLDDSRGIVWSLEGIGQMLKNTGRLRSALEHFAEAKNIAAAANDVRGLAYALKCHAECLSLLGHPQTAIEEASLAVNFFKRIGFRVGLGYALKALGDILRISHDPMMALESYRQAAAVFSRSRDVRGLAYTFNGIGFLFSTLGEADTAAACFGRTVHYFNITRLQFGQTQSMSGFRHLIARRQLSLSQMRELLQTYLTSRMALPTVVLRTTEPLAPERLELVMAGWQLLNNQHSLGVADHRGEHAQSWQEQLYRHDRVAASHGMLQDVAGEVAEHPRSLDERQRRPATPRNRLQGVPY